MNEVATREEQPRNQPPIVRFKQNLTALVERKELALPSNVSPEAFKNAAIVAVQDNPSILGCKPDSIFRAIRRLAAAGLVPDGREAAIVPFRGEAQAMPMVFGIIKTARNSGEIVTIWADVVYEKEEFRIWIENGERKYDHVCDPFDRSGPIKGAYAVAKLKDGTVEFEPMGSDQIEKRRKASANQKSEQPTGIWQQWYEEMAKKTVIRALCKRLPISSEDLRRITAEDDTTSIRDVTPQETNREDRLPLSQRLRQAHEEAQDGQPLDGEVIPPENEDAAPDSAQEADDTDTQAGDSSAPEEEERAKKPEQKGRAADQKEEPQPDPFSDAYLAGAAAFNDGAEISTSPHKRGTNDDVQWRLGWQYAKKENAA